MVTKKTVKDKNNSNDDKANFCVYPKRAEKYHEYTDHIVGYNYEKRNPSWVLECLDKRNLGVENIPDGRIGFQPDPFHDVRFKTRRDDYSKSGYARGHMATACNHKWDLTAIKETYLLSNVVPQHVAQNGKVWNQLEEFVTHLIKEMDKIWTLTGPLYMPKTLEGNKRVVSYQVIGEAEIAVPTHIYKVILTEKNGKLSMGTFLTDNAFAGSRLSLPQTKSTLETVEKYSGMQFFKKLDRSSVSDMFGADGSLTAFLRDRRMSNALHSLSRAWTVEKADEIMTKLKREDFKPTQEVLEAFRERVDDIQSNPDKYTSKQKRIGPFRKPNFFNKDKPVATPPFKAEDGEADVTEKKEGENPGNKK